MSIINLASIKQKIIRFIIVQLFLTLISLPILVAWGLPLSILSPLGNLIFAPLLTLFLLFSSLLFFCELVYLPNAWLVWPLELIAAVWQKLLCLEQGTMLYAFAKPSLWVLLVIAGATLLAMLLKITLHPARSILMLSMLFVVSIIFLKAHSPAMSWKRDIPCNNGNLTLIHSNGNTVLIDPGFIGRRPSAPSWVSYTLIPEITKQTGKLTIDHLIVLQPGTILFQALTTLCTKMTVKNVYLVYWQGMMPYSAWSHFKKLQEQIANSNTILRRIEKYDIKIQLSENATLHIQPLADTLRYQTATYPAIAVTTQIDNESFTLYAAHHAKQSSRKENCS